MTTSMWTTARVTGHGRSSTESLSPTLYNIPQGTIMPQREWQLRDKGRRAKGDCIAPASCVTIRCICLAALAANLMRTPAALV